MILEGVFGIRAAEQGRVSLGNGSGATRPERRNEEDEGFSQPCFKNAWKSIGMGMIHSHCQPPFSGLDPGLALPEIPRVFVWGSTRAFPRGLGEFLPTTPREGIHGSIPAPGASRSSSTSMTTDGLMEIKPSLR